MSNSNIGTLVEAEDAVITHLYHYEAGTLSKGWTFLGSGIHRYAYLSPSGLVYKVPSSLTSRASRQANTSEAKGAAILAKVESDEFAVPLTNVFHVEDDCPIVVMENCGEEMAYLDGDQLARAKRFFRNTDTHCGNMRIVNGKVVMIDLGFFVEDGGERCECCSCCPCDCGHRECGECGNAQEDCDCCGDCGERNDNCECHLCDHGMHIDDHCDECEGVNPNCGVAGCEAC